MIKLPEQDEGAQGDEHGGFCVSRPAQGAQVHLGYCKGKIKGGDHSYKHGAEADDLRIPVEESRELGRKNHQGHQNNQHHDKAD